jgi:hypothetical protein
LLVLFGRVERWSRADKRGIRTRIGVLNKRGIGIDDAVNGAALGTEVHEVARTAEYYDNVNQVLDAADKIDGREGVIDMLCQIGCWAAPSSLNC